MTTKSPTAVKLKKDDENTPNLNRVILNKNLNLREIEVAGT